MTPDPDDEQGTWNWKRIGAAALIGTSALAITIYGLSYWYAPDNQPIKKAEEKTETSWKPDISPYVPTKDEVAVVVKDAIHDKKEESPSRSTVLDSALSTGAHIWTNKPKEFNDGPSEGPSSPSGSGCECYVPVGASIPIQIVTAWNTDTPGTITFRVPENVHGRSQEGACLAIPASSLITGEVASSTDFFQKRGAAALKFIQRPGYEKPIEIDLAAADAMGQPGLVGHRQTYLGQKVIAATMSAVLDVGVAYAGRGGVNIGNEVSKPYQDLLGQIIGRKPTIDGNPLREGLRMATMTVNAPICVSSYHG